MSSHDIPVSRPLSVWNKPLKVKFKDLFRSLTKSAAQGFAGKADGAIKDAVDALTAVSFGNDYSGIAWVLILRALLQSVYTLVEENEELLIKDPTNERVVQYKLGDLADDPDSLLNGLDWSLEEKQLEIGENFFRHPRELSILEDVKELFAGWLERFGLTEAQSKSITDRLPSYFVYALNDQWRERAEEYLPLKEAFDTPFTNASAKEQAWFRYTAWLKKQVDEGMFDEAISLRQVYVPLRGYYERKAAGEKEKRPEYKPFGEKQSEKVVVELEKYLEEWLNKTDAYDAIKVISGGPGSGKSSLAKMFAAHQAGKTDRRILFVPLHRFDPSDDLIEAVGNFVRFDEFLTHNPLDPKEGDPRLLIIFDGLDELSEQSKAGAEIAQQFVAEVHKKVMQFNGSGARSLKVIISGRELVVQANASEFRSEQQIINVLPYLIKEQERNEYIGEKELIELDQRSEWWKAYGRVSGENYEGLPEELTRAELLEITSQPLLNYLVAQSFERGEIDFSTETNLNNIYKDLLESVYHRRWAKSPHPATKDVEEAQFVRILEEVAVAAWHGDGRKTTVREIEAHCETSGLKTLLNALQEGASKGVTRLLMAFYFRRAGNTVAGDQTFEFTHKSFGEYLTARRIVGVIAHLHVEMERKRQSFDSGYDERDALERWLKLCGPVALDKYVLEFIRSEMLLRDKMAEVSKWQDTIIRLINFVLRNGMPMDRLNPRPTFYEESKQARNAEEALLCLLNICANLTERISKIEWPSPHACGEWITRLQAQTRDLEKVYALHFLSFLDLEGCVLDDKDLVGADLSRTNLKSASLAFANLSSAMLDDADLQGCSLLGVTLSNASLKGFENYLQELKYADLNGALLEGAKLEGVDLSHRDLSGVGLTNANLKGAKLEHSLLPRANLVEAGLEGANLERAILLDANLIEANLTEANLKKTYLFGAQLTEAILDGANLEKANLEYASLVEASLRNANLVNANLEDADLREADLEGANLEGANLEGAWLNGVKMSDKKLLNEYRQKAMVRRSAPEEDEGEEEAE
jgi:uncharacterized protein YjbI with pentapeptide repeats